MEANSILKGPDLVESRTMAAEFIPIGLDTGIYYSLNRVGSEFWELLDGRQTIAEHAGVIAGNYDVPVDRVTADLLELSEQKVRDQLRPAGRNRLAHDWSCQTPGDSASVKAPRAGSPAEITGWGV